MKKRFFVGAVLVFSQISVTHADIDFNSGGTETINSRVDDRVCVDFATDQTPGTHLILNDGAYIASPDMYNGINAYHHGSVTINGGMVDGRVNANDSSQITVYGGKLNGDIISWDNSRVNITGNAELGYVLAEDFGNIRIEGGTINRSIEAYRNSSISISGGKLNYSLYAIENGTISLEGTGFKIGGVSVSGLLDLPYLVSIGALDLHALSEYNHYDYIGKLSGTLSDGSVLSDSFISIVHRPQNSVLMDGANFNFVITPEPCTLLLLGVGGLLIRKRTRPFSS